MADEFGKSVEFTKVNEFAEVKESYINSPEFPARPDEFAYPGTTGTSDKRSRGNMALLYYATVAAAILMVVNVTNGFRVPYADYGETPDNTPQQTENVIVPGEYKDIDGEEGDPFIRILMAKTDGSTLYYSYVCALGQYMKPVSVHAAVYDADGREANPADDPDVWTGSRDVFEYMMDVSALQGDMTLVLTGTFEKDGEERQIVKTCKVDDINMFPGTESYLTLSDPSGSAANIDYTAFFLINENDPHMREYDLEVSSFYLEWYDADKQYIGGGVSVWDDDVPEMSMIASAPGYSFAYRGPAHTDYAPDGTSYFAVGMRLTDRSTGKMYVVEGTPEAMPGASTGADMTEVLAAHHDWYNAKTGDYLHFGSSQGFRAHMIDSSVLFYRFAWSGGAGEPFTITETYHQVDMFTTEEHMFILSGSEDDGYVLTDAESSDTENCYKPVPSVDYEGYAYMCHICDLDTCSTLADLNMFMTMFEVQNAKFEISEVAFEIGNHGKMIFYGDAGASWWPYDTQFTYSTASSDNPLDIMLSLNVADKVQTSKNSTFTGNISAYIEYYGDGPMLVINEFGPVTHNTMFEWLGDPGKPSVVTARTVGVYDAGTGQYFSTDIGPDEDAQQAAEALAKSKLKGWTVIELELHNTFLEFPNPDSSTQLPEVNNYHEEFVFKVS